MNKHAVWFFAVASVALSAMIASQPGYAATYDFGSLRYRGIGPAIAGGRTTSVVGTDLDPLLYFAGGAAGGVFKTTDGGFTWLPVFDKADVAAIGAIALGPHDPNDVWVGTGESNPRNDVEGGDGVWHSKDGGKTWAHVGLEDAGSISNISIDPRDARRVVVGVLGHVFRDSAMRGIYTTTDGGAHWTRALYVGPSTGASDVIRAPGHPETLFAGMYEVRRKPWTMMSGGPDGGLYRSDDGGNTWRKLTGNGLPGGNTGRIGLSAAAGGRVYAIIQSNVGDLWRSDDGGATWRVMPRNWLVGGRRFYFTRVFVDPADPNRLIDVGLILSISTDGGRTFKKTATNAGWDYHQAWWSQDGKRVALGTDEGVVMSADTAATWHQPYDLPFAQAYHVGFDDAQPNYHVCIGLQDNDTWCGSSNGDSGLGVLNRDWLTVGPGDGMWALYDPLDPHLIWSTSTNSGTGQTYLWDSRTQQAADVSPDAELAGLAPARQLGHRFNWDSPIAFTTDGKALVGGNVVYESADRGMHWTIISPDLTRNDKSHQGVPGGPIDADMSGAEAADNILYIASSNLEDGLLWVGTDDGLVQITRDGGRSWSNVTPKDAPTWGRVFGIESGRFAAGTAFVAIDDHMLGDERPYLYMTRDYGKNWTSISGDLPKNVFARSIRQDPVDHDLLYAGTQRGVWASWDMGAHWRSLRLNMPASPIYDIEIQPRADDLLVASHGRGVWVLDDLRPLQELASTSGPVTLFAPRDAYRWFRWSPVNPFPDGQPTNDFAGPNVAYGALITYDLAKGKHKAASIQIIDSSGHIVRRLTGKALPHADGLNRTAWDLNEDGPIKWKGTYETNQGSGTGAEAMPGIYTVRLAVDGVVREQRVTVKLDPRDPATFEQARLRHDTLSELYAEQSAIDVMLNAIDKKMKSATPSSRAALLAFKQRLTSNPRNDEDLSGPPGVRDRVGDLIYRISGSSYQTPTQAQLDVAATLKQAFAKLALEYKSL